MAVKTVLAALGMAAGKVIVKKATESLLDNLNQLYTYVISNFSKIRNQDVRFSISYLIRIKIPGTSKFLLVRGHRIKNQLQPVGGVYKKVNGFSEFREWGYKEDSSNRGIKTDDVSLNDLRFRVQGKYTLNVIKWFEYAVGREYTFEREFEEELIETGILDAEIFRKKTLEKVSKVMKVFNYSTFHQCYEVLIYDIVEFHPTAEQEQALKQLLDRARNEGDEYMLVDVTEIERLLVMENEEQIARIGEHTKYLINEK
ncbi:hypothetical protein RAH57_13525 [Chryseobacterium sp. CKR4-1]|uniref:SMODS-associated NUDIX domain-containing protein n=1 Tax=Chryseobacterium sp. CKR4-1 TaxID=3068896 RepID=UPI002796A82B|nr:hypothetical protein [Chryseobacterium sp. CKR4-1]MDQ1805014.1 hypothetical protein [Chryseobacterium sp. CKR4-1]